jgi:hypothetical protein
MSKSYKRARRDGYPSLGDQLDAIWKMLEPADASEAKAIKDAIATVKAAYPKP